MTDYIHALVLALIQGLSEFLPISSSAHLILSSQILDWQNQGLTFDVAVHLGTLLAVVIYFRIRVSQVTIGALNALRGRNSDDGKMAWMLVLATIPAGLAGFFFSAFIEAELRSTQVIGVATLIGAVLLFAADRWQSDDKQLSDLTWVMVLFIGIAQATALIPGTSRSGITITAALFLGLSRGSAAEFSFLMSIPIIILSAVWQGMGLMSEPNVDWAMMFFAIVVSGVSAFLCIKYFLILIEKIGMLPFVLYRLALGTLLLLVFV